MPHAPYLIFLHLATFRAIESQDRLWVFDSVNIEGSQRILRQGDVCGGFGPFLELYLDQFEDHCFRGKK